MHTFVGCECCTYALGNDDNTNIDSTGIKTDYVRLSNLNLSLNYNGVNHFPREVEGRTVDATHCRVLPAVNGSYSESTGFFDEFL